MTKQLSRSNIISQRKTESTGYFRQKRFQFHIKDFWLIWHLFSFKKGIYCVKSYFDLFVAEWAKSGLVVRVLTWMLE